MKAAFALFGRDCFNPLSEANYRKFVYYAAENQQINKHAGNRIYVLSPAFLNSSAKQHHVLISRKRFPATAYLNVRIIDIEQHLSYETAISILM